MTSEVEHKSGEFLAAMSAELGVDVGERRAAVLREIESTGTYRHTENELHQGSLMAWRNHARCIGRLHWQSLRVIDKRTASTAEEVFAACVEHLDFATNGGYLRPAITVFAPEESDGGQIRIWNSQLIRYAGYTQPDGTVVGDPLNRALTTAISDLGWRGAGTAFDVLPLVIQMPGEEPQIFELPSSVVLEVPLSHPTLPWFTDLGLRWHAVPAISDMRLEIGGINYPACPFNGWYVSFEIGSRNLSDHNRYNLLPVIAEKMGLNMTHSSTLWKDRALIELNQAVLYSFQLAKVRIVDHHQAAKQFRRYETNEELSGRAVSADWAWVVPPISGSTAPTFHRGYSDKKLSPNFYHQPVAWKQSGNDSSVPSTSTPEGLPVKPAGCPVAH